MRVFELAGTIATLLTALLAVLFWGGRRLKTWIGDAVGGAAQTDLEAVRAMQTQVVQAVKTELNLDADKLNEIHQATRQLNRNGGSHLADSVAHIQTDLGEVKTQLANLTGQFTQHIAESRRAGQWY